MFREYEVDLGTRPFRYLTAQMSKGFLLPGLLSIPVILLCVLLFGSGHWYAAVLGILLGAWIVFGGIWIWRIQLARRRLQSISSPVFHYRIDDTGYHYQNEIGSGTLPWGFRGQVERSQGLVYIRSPEVGVLPLPDDTDEELQHWLSERLR